jgi:hypothetical protein
LRQGPCVNGNVNPVVCGAPRDIEQRFRRENFRLTFRYLRHLFAAAKAV